MPSLKKLIFADTVMKVYLDNAATTPIAKEVITEITPYLTDHFGNPSSTHSFGRKTKNAIAITFL